MPALRLGIASGLGRRSPIPLCARLRLQIFFLDLRTFQRGEVEFRISSLQTLPQSISLPVIPHQWSHPRLYIPVQSQGCICALADLARDIRDLIFWFLVREFDNPWFASRRVWLADVLALLVLALGFGG